MTLERAGTVIAIAFFAAVSMWPVHAWVHFDDGRHPAVVSCDAPIAYIINYRDAVGVPGTDSTSTIATGLACAKRAQVMLAVGVIGTTATFISAFLWQGRRERGATSRRASASAS